MTEQTIIKVMDIPAEPGFVWHPDLNIVALSVHLDAEGRDRALVAVQEFWRRSCIRGVA